MVVYEGSHLEMDQNQRLVVEGVAVQIMFNHCQKQKALIGQYERWV